MASRSIVYDVAVILAVADGRELDYTLGEHAFNETNVQLCHHNEYKSLDFLTRPSFTNAAMTSCDV